MRASGVSPDVTTYNVAIAACQRAGRWETAGALQAGRDAVGGRPEWPENLLAFNAALRRHDVRSRQVSSKVSFNNASRTLDTMNLPTCFSGKKCRILAKSFASNLGYFRTFLVGMPPV